MSGWYNIAWAIVLLPLAGALASFVCETPRRAAQTCMVFNLLALGAATYILIFRLGHQGDAQFDGLFTFWQFSPTGGKVPLPTNFQPQLGVRVDALSAVFCVLFCFLVLAVQLHTVASMRGDAGFRRVFWVSSVLLFGLVGCAAAPNLFQFWFMWEVAGAAAFVLALHWWHITDVASAARRVWLTLRADAVLLLGLAIVFVRLGPDIISQPLPANATINDPFDFSLIRDSVGRVHAGLVAGVGARTLLGLAVLVTVAALLRAVQIPLHTWLIEMDEAPLPGLILGAVGITATGALLIARMYPALLVVPHLLAVMAIVGGASALIAAVISMFQRDMARLALWLTIANVGLIVAAFGAGGFSPGLYMLITGVLFTTVLFMAGSSVVRAYRTRNIEEMGGAWSTMRTTSILLGIWAVAVSGANLANYSVISALMRNELPGGGHLNTIVRAAGLALTTTAAVAMSLSAARLWVKVCVGEPMKRRGFLPERIREAEARLNRTAIVVVLVGVIALAASIPAAPGGLTFSHFVFFGSQRQVLSVIGPAAGLAVLPFLALMGGWALLRGADRRSPADSAGGWRGPIAQGFYVQHLVRGSASLLVDRGGALFRRLDTEFTDPILDSTGTAYAIAARGVGQLRTGRFQLQLMGAMLLGGALVAAGLLFATGHLGAAK